MENKQKSKEQITNIFEEIKNLYGLLLTNKSIDTVEVGFYTFLFPSEQIKKFYNLNKKVTDCVDKILYILSTLKPFIEEDFDLYVDELIDESIEKYGFVFSESVEKLESFITSSKFKDDIENDLEDFIEYKKESLD